MRPATALICQFIGEKKEEFGVAPICRALSAHGIAIAPRTYFAHRAAVPGKRALWDTAVTEILAGIYEPDGNGRRPPESLYGTVKMWACLNRQGIPVAKCTVERLKRAHGWRGATRGRRVRTTIADPAASRAPDLVRRLLFTGSAAAQPSTSAAAATGHRIQIYEIWYNSPGPDTGSNASLNAEWVELHNTSSTKISLKNWTLRDAAGHVFVFHRYSLGGHRYVKIHTGRGTATRTNRYWNRSWYVWNNTGDTAKLRDNLGGRVDRCTYTGTSAEHVFC